MTRKQKLVVDAIKARAATRRRITPKELAADCDLTLWSIHGILQRLRAQGRIRNTIEVLE